MAKQKKYKLILTNIGFPIQLKAFLCFFFLLLVTFCMVSGAHARTAEEWYAMGFEQSLEGDRQKAVRSYQQALRLKKNWPKVHHNLALLFYHLKDGVKAVHHLRLAEKLYLKDSSPESKRNLQIVQKNLEKTYAKFDLNSEEFEDLSTMHPVTHSPTWAVKGYGFAMRGYVFTLANSLGDAEQVRVRFGNQPPMSAKIVQRYIIYDLALLKLETEKPGLLLADSSVHQVGDFLESPDIDGGGSDSSPLMKGKVAGLKAIMNDKNIFELDFPSPPVPGSPLLNEEGQVVGIILSTSQIVKNFQAAGMPPDGSIALKSSYLSRIFSLYINSLEGPRKKRSGHDREEPVSSPRSSTTRRNPVLAVVEGRMMPGGGP